MNLKTRLLRNKEEYSRLIQDEWLDDVESEPSEYPCIAIFKSGFSHSVWQTDIIFVYAGDFVAQIDNEGA